MSTLIATSPASSTSTDGSAARDGAHLVRLRVQWAIIALCALLLVAAGTVWLRRSWDEAFAMRWLVVSTAILGRELWLLWRGLTHNRRAADEPLLPTLGYGNALSIGRGVLIALVAGFIVAPRPPDWLAWAPGLLYTVAAVMDHLDGYVARITNHATKLGEMLDMDYDVLGVLAAVLLAISYGQVPLWYLAVGLARELFLFGHWVLRRQGKPIYDLPPSADRRLIAGLQMGFLSIVLYPLFAPPATTLAALLFALPMAVSFGRDWMVTSGAWQTTAPDYLRRRRLAKLLLEQWTPLAARLGGLAAGSVLLRQVFLHVASWQGLIGSSGVVWAVLALAVIALLLLGAGLLGRLAALCLIAVACLDMLATGFAWGTNGLLLGCCIYVAQFGSGLWALWQPEEQLLRRRAGERASAA